MSFHDFCKEHGVSRGERRQLAIYLVALRLHKLLHHLFGV